MLATSISGRAELFGSRFEVTQSMPQAIHEMRL